MVILQITEDIVLYMSKLKESVRYLLICIFIKFIKEGRIQFIKLFILIPRNLEINEETSNHNTIIREHNEI